MKHFDRVILCVLIAFFMCTALPMGGWFSAKDWRGYATSWLDRAREETQKRSAWLYDPFGRFIRYLGGQPSALPAPSRAQQLQTRPTPLLPVSPSQSSPLLSRLLVASRLSKTFECNYPTFASWDTACRSLQKQSIPWNLKMKLGPPKVIVDKDCFFNVLKEFVEESKERLKQYGIEVKQYTFKPFVGKLELPNDALVAFHGDLHGDVHSLNTFIRKLQKDGYMSSDDGFKIHDSHFYMIFLGDYTDRGLYGMEVIYTIIRLKLANPDRVFLVRGNHEDLDMIERYGFQKELESKVGEDVYEYRKQLDLFYNVMPVALYMGTKDESSNHKDFILCCHGGIELGFDANELLKSDREKDYMYVGELKRKKYESKYGMQVQNEIEEAKKTNSGLKYYVIDKTNYDPSGLGFMWNDFQVDSEAPLGYRSGRGLIISKSLLEDHLRTRSQKSSHSLKGVFRAHQHDFKLSPMMTRILNKDNLSPKAEEGVGKIWGRASKPSEPTVLWPGIVVTFLVAPLTPYSIVGFDYDAFGLLKLAPKFENWQLKVIRTDKNDILH